MTARNINELAAAIHEAAVAKGFWDVENAKEKHVAKWRGELGEVIQADRMGMMYEVERDGAKPEGVAAELADFVMMALDLFAEDGDDIGFELISRVYSMSDSPDDEHIKTSPVEVLVNALYKATEHVLHREGVLRHGHVTCIVWPKIWLEARGYDLLELIREKMIYNESRPKLHGRAY